MPEKPSLAQYGVAAVQAAAGAGIRVEIVNPEDAAHLAFASICQIEFLCAWNFKHLANVLALRRLRQVNEKRGLLVPQVCTPEELPGE